MQGPSISHGAGPAPLVDAAAPSLAGTGADSLAARTCTPGALQPAAVKGKVVLCERGAADPGPDHPTWRQVGRLPCRADPGNDNPSRAP